MSDLDLCKWETFEIMGTGGVSKCVGWRFGDLAAHQFGKRWTLTHLPSGTSLKNGNCIFRNVESAVGAMIEISRLRNSWDFIDISDEERLVLRDTVSEIGKKFGGMDGKGKEYAAYRSGLNGYGAAE